MRAFILAAAAVVFRHAPAALNRRYPLLQRGIRAGKPSCSVSHRSDQHRHQHEHQRRSPSAKGSASTEWVDPSQCIYFIMGGPGSGKGTQCELLTERFHMTHLSAGELLRQEVRSGSEEGQRIAKVIKEGQIVASETTVALLQRAMAERQGPFLIDGFPRSLENLHAFEQLVRRPAFMLFFDVTEDEMLCRLLKRGLSSGRSDDNEETIRKRFRTFVGDSLPVVNLLQRRGMLRRIDAQASPEEVFQRVCEAFADQKLRICGQRLNDEHSAEAAALV